MKVSIITPVYNQKKNVIKILKSLMSQTWKGELEFVVCDDNSEDNLCGMVERIQQKKMFPVKYVNTERDGYNLAMARNMGIIESDADCLLFCDSRLSPLSDALEAFVQAYVNFGIHGKHTWFFGNKIVNGKLGNKTEFVENFSFVNRINFIRSGMFCERITKYGGMTRELRGRFSAQGWMFKFVHEARAQQLNTSMNREQKEKDAAEMKKLLEKMGY